MLPNDEQLLAQAIEAVAADMAERNHGPVTHLVTAIADGVVRTLDRLGWGLTPPITDRDLLAGYDPSRATGPDYNLHWQDAEDRSTDPWPSQRSLSSEMELAAARLDGLLEDLGKATATEWYVAPVGGGNLRIATKLTDFGRHTSGHRLLTAAADGDCYLPQADTDLWWLVEEFYDENGEQFDPEDPTSKDIACGRVIGAHLTISQLVDLAGAHACWHEPEMEDSDVCVECGEIFCPSCAGVVTVDVEEGEYLHWPGAVCELVGKQSVVGR